MSRRRSGVEARARKTPDALIFVLIVGGIWLSWQIVRQAAVSLAPPSIALRLNPGSQTALTQTAEAELRAGRTDNARALAVRTLAQAPFNVRALRVAGLAADAEGDTARADQVLTLAGNWSLRDDPTHSWLVRQRLRQNRPGSAFAHADTLLRRRADIADRYFDLFSSGAASGNREAQGALIELMKRRPPWRGAFLTRLNATREALPVAVALAVALKGTDAAFSDAELAEVYRALVNLAEVGVVRRLRAELDGRQQGLLSGGDFSTVGVAPFGWALPSAPGVLSEIINEPESSQPALHAIVSDLGAQVVAEQLVLIPPGRWRLAGRFRVDQGEPGGRLSWVVGCTEGGRPLGIAPLAAASNRRWTAFSAVVGTPIQGCGAQWLRLMSTPQDRRSTHEAWVDDLTLTPLR